MCVPAVVVEVYGMMLSIFGFFFFQAGDGIRGWSVAGVQTCALPICVDPQWNSPEQWDDEKDEDWEVGAEEALG